MNIVVKERGYKQDMFCFVRSHTEQAGTVYLVIERRFLVNICFNETAIT